MYNQPNKKLGPRRKLLKMVDTQKFKFDVGDLVRLSYKAYIFQRGYLQKWTTEIFRITDRKIKQSYKIYKIKDLLNELVHGSFYESELQKVDKKDSDLFIIEKIIKKRKRAGNIEFFVKFQGYPNRFNDWVRKDDIENLEKK